MDIDQIIKRRKTRKVLPDTPWPVNLTGDALKVLVDELLDLAAYAPYHFPANRAHITAKDLKSTLPFRFYILDGEKCRATAQFFQDEGIEAGKMQNLLDAADVLFIVTWLPEPSELNHGGPKNEVAFEGNVHNMEHLAATGAAIQNVLIGATARNIPSYWSTGGKLRTEALKNHLGIPLDEIIAGTVFLYPKDVESAGVKIVPGGMRSLGKEKETWSKWV